MNSKKLYKNYHKDKNKFYRYINEIKKNSIYDIYTIINTTLIVNPFVTSFPKKFFINEFKVSYKLISFIKNSIQFYIRQFYSLFSYFISFIIYKLYYKNKSIITNKTIGIDIFFLVDNIIKDDKLNENYFIGLYNILDKYKQDYIFIPRLYGISKNPFKLIKFFKIIRTDKRIFLFEFEYLSFMNFIVLFFMILAYPFKTLRLLQKEKTNIDKLFNNELINDIGSFEFDAFSRYIYGKNISQERKINKIYSWHEFQVVERSFNYGIRINNDKTRLIGCQFYLNYETYFNAYVNDIDNQMLSSPHEVLVNGKYYISDIKKVTNKLGVSLRYKNIFNFEGIKSEDNILLLGSYIKKDTQYMIDSVKNFEKIIFKNHPAINIENFANISSNIKISSDNIYELFENTKLVIGTASGTSLEAVSCGLSVIIIASQDYLTANPLVDYGKGQIWDIAFSKDDVKKVYNNLIKYRTNNIKEIKEISSWYKDNFFIEPIEENIVKVFELNKDE